MAPDTMQSLAFELHVPQEDLRNRALAVELRTCVGTQILSV